MKIHNFSAGPSILPKEVMQKASQAVKELDDSGLSLIEISHRSKSKYFYQNRQNTIKLTFPQREKKSV